MRPEIWDILKKHKWDMGYWGRRIKGYHDIGCWQLTRYGILGGAIKGIWDIGGQLRGYGIFRSDGPRCRVGKSLPSAPLTSVICGS